MTYENDATFVPSDAVTAVSDRTYLNLEAGSDEVLERCLTGGPLRQDSSSTSRPDGSPRRT